MSDSIWKKEISFKRKPKDSAPVEPAAAPETPAEPKQSIWKKEISLGRKKEEDQVARLVEMATRTVAPDFEPAPVEPVTPPTQLAEAVVSAAPPVPADLPVHPVDLLPVDEPVPAPVPLARIFVPDLPPPRSL